MCAFAATPIGKRIYDWLNGHLKQGVLTVADCGGMLCVLAAAAAYLVSGSYNPFVYVRC